MKNLLYILLLINSYLYSYSIEDFINKKNCSQIVDKQVFTVCYDYGFKGAKYVAYELDGNLVNKLNIKDRERFYSEKNIPVKYRSDYSDYTRSGYDRGHLASDGSFDYDEKVLRKTYSMINIIPQSPMVNRKTWIKSEKYERLVASKLGKVFVINGVEYGNNPKRIGKNQIAVPEGYWKMLFNNKGFERCFYYKNELDVDVKGDKLRNHEIDCKKLK